MTSRFRALILEGLKRFAQSGPPSDIDLAEWLGRIQRELDIELPTDAETAAQLRDVLQAIYTREVERGGVGKRVPEVLRYTIDQVAPQLRAELDRRIYAGADLIKINKAQRKAETLRRFAGWITSVPIGGMPKADLRTAAREIGKPIKQVRFEARRVAIDQGHKLAAAVAHVVASEAGAIAAIWHDRGEFDKGYDARPEHLARSGKLFLVRDSWAMEGGLVRRGGPYTDDVEQPAHLPYCFPATTCLDFAQNVEIGYRRWYRGELTKLVTASGKTLQATPNHPILTPKGWVNCGALQEGDYIVEITEKRVNAIISELANDGRKPMISEIFDALCKEGTTTEIPGARNQFHGDGSEANVDIVRPAWPLSFDFVTTRSKRLNQFALAKTDCRSPALRSFTLLSKTTAFIASPLVGALNASHSPFGTMLGHGEVSGLPLGSNNAPSIEDSFRNRSTTDAEFGGQRLNGLAGFVTATKLVSVERTDFAGHVYNLQTADGWYSANGIIVHNCSCYYEYISSPGRLPDALLTAKGREWVGSRHDSAIFALANAVARIDPNPSAAKVRTGTYRKGHARIAGLDVTIENGRGTVRTGVAADGEQWAVIMPAHYGYVKRARGADGENLDCYIGPYPDPRNVWIIEQRDPDTGAYDEDKVMLGFASRAQAIHTYRLGFSDGRGHERIGGVREVPIAEFRRQLAA